MTTQCVRSVLPRDLPPVVPMGALAHASAAFEQSTGGRVMKVRVANAPGAPAFEAAIAKGGAVLYMRIASPSEDVTEIDVNHLPSWLVSSRQRREGRCVT